MLTFQFSHIVRYAFVFLFASQLSIHQLYGQANAGESVLNPNLAGKEELLAVEGMSEAIVEALMDKRPFLSTSDFHAFMSTSLSAEQLATTYQTVFIPINLNIATKEEMLLVPGVGDKMAHEFEEYRPYKMMAQFEREIGKYVDDEEVARLAKYVFVPIELNTASDEAILSIPGVGDRMLHEFKEYRPYKSIVQFRREIGKYVDEKELARLERYVVLEGGE